EALRLHILGEVKADRGGEILLVVRVVAALAVAERHSQQLANYLVVALVRGELLAEPQIEDGLLDTKLNGGVRLRQHQAAPDVGEVVEVGVAGQQRLDQALPLVRRLVRKEGPRFGNRGNTSGKVEVDAAQESGVVRQRRRFDARGGPASS